MSAKKDQGRGGNEGNSRRKKREGGRNNGGREGWEEWVVSLPTSISSSPMYIQL